MKFFNGFSKSLLSIGLVFGLCQEAAFSQAKAENTIVVAISPNFAPFSYLGDNGEITGLDIDVMNAIAKNKNLTVEYRVAPFSQIFTEIDNKTADAAISAIFHTEDRASKYALTQPYSFEKPIYFYRADNEKFANMELSSLIDLGGKELNLSGTEGTKQVEAIKTISAIKSANEVKSDFLSFTGVLQKKFDVGFTDSNILQNFIKNNLKAGAVELKSVAYQGELGYVMVLHKDNTELLKKLDEGINELVQNGEIQRLRHKYEIK